MKYRLANVGVPVGVYAEVPVRDAVPRRGTLGLTTSSIVKA